MASIYKQMDLNAPADQVWEAIRDWGAVHKRLAPGFVKAVEVEPNARVVTFGNGAKARELIVGVDDAARRLAYSVAGGQSAHHNASLQVFHIAPGKSLLVWVTDLLPDAAATRMNAMMEEGALVIKTTLERAAAR